MIKLKSFFELGPLVLIRILIHILIWGDKKCTKNQPLALSSGLRLSRANPMLFQFTATTPAL
jgi:hypothetical protein